MADYPDEFDYDDIPDIPPSGCLKAILGGLSIGLLIIAITLLSRCMA